MRHEIIRMEHVNISRPGRHEIEDLNLIIWRTFSRGKERSQEAGFTWMDNHGSRKENGILRMPAFL